MFPTLQHKFMWSNLHVLVLLVMMVSLIPAYGCLGFLPIFKGTVRFGGLTTQGEMFGLAVYFGLCLCKIALASFDRLSLSQVLRTVHSRATLELSTRNYYLLGKKPDGMCLSQHSMQKSNMLVRYGLFSITDKVGVLLSYSVYNDCMTAYSQALSLVRSSSALSQIARGTFVTRSFSWYSWCGQQCPCFST